MPAPEMQLVLASSSTFRQSQLERLGCAFITDAPEIDESRLPEETPHALVCRLSRAKTQAVAARHPHALVIGSDQVAVIDGQVLGKPGNHETATAQLKLASGRTMVFLTGLVVMNSTSGNVQLDVARTEVGFRKLTDADIDTYLQRDQPYQCAGSIRSEALGPALFRYQLSDDPSALVGLPLMRLTHMLALEGLDVLHQASLERERFQP